MTTVILAGGSGSRLWPLSRSLYPKQFLALVSEKSMFQETLARLKDHSALIVVCNEEHRFLVGEQLREIGIENATIILEPEGRNTAPAVALAAIAAREAGRADEPLLVLSADHAIPDVSAYQTAVATADGGARRDALVTFGIEPVRPETGYGYIQRGAADGDFYQVARFVEKPDAATAQGYLEGGEHYWNSGMFMFTPKVYMDQLQAFAPDIATACEASMEGAAKDGDFLRPGREAFLGCRAVSIDYAIMEKTDKALILPLDAGWSDVGSWTSLWEIMEKDAEGNSVRGDIKTIESKDCFIRSEKLVVAIGLEDTIIVDTPDALLVASKGSIDALKGAVESLKVDEGQITELHRKVYRPWGNYDSVDAGEGFQVKRITVNPGSKLSLQMHHHRAEHWIIVSGKALVTVGDKESELVANQSTYVPVGATHRLENRESEPLVMIEVQSGSYLGEDDIVRFDDVYGRIPEQAKPDA